MGRRVLRRHIWGYFVCLCPIKRTPGVYGLRFSLIIGLQESGLNLTDKNFIKYISSVLLAGVSGGFPGVLPFRPPIDWLVSMSEIILKGTLN